MFGFTRLYSGDRCQLPDPTRSNPVSLAEGRGQARKGQQKNRIRTHEARVTHVPSLERRITSPGGAADLSKW